MIPDPSKIRIGDRFISVRGTEEAEVIAIHLHEVTLRLRKVGGKKWSRFTLSASALGQSGWRTP